MVAVRSVPGTSLTGGSRVAAYALEVGQGIERRGAADALARFVLDTEDRARMGIDHQPDGLAGQLKGHLETSALIGNGPVLSDEAVDAMMEQGIDLRSLWSQALLDNQRTENQRKTPSLGRRWMLQGVLMVGRRESNPRPGKPHRCAGKP